MKTSRSAPALDHEHRLDRVAVMLRGGGPLSLARRRPLTASLHSAVSRESGRLERARRAQDAGRKEQPR